MLTSFTASASVKVYFQDAKFPTQAMVEKQSFGSPVAATTSTVLSAVTGPTSSVATTVSTFSAQPDVPRNLVLTPSGVTTDIRACSIVVNGSNILNATIAETFTVATNQSTAVTGSKAFKSVSSVVFATGCEALSFGALWSLGLGEKLGLKNCMDNKGDWVQSEASGVYSATRPTILVDSSVVESNTADFNESMSASVPLIGYFFQNYRCQP